MLVVFRNLFQMLLSICIRLLLVGGIVWLSMTKEELMLGVCLSPLSHELLPNWEKSQLTLFLLVEVGLQLLRSVSCITSLCDDEFAP